MNLPRKNKNMETFILKHKSSGKYFGTGNFKVSEPQKAITFSEKEAKEWLMLYTIGEYEMVKLINSK